MKNYFSISIIFLYIVVSFLSCRNKELDAELNLVYSKTIDLPLEEFVYLTKNADSTSNKNANYYLLHFIDSASCNLCALNATNTWYNRLKQEPYYTKVVPIIVFCPLKNDRGKYFDQLYYNSDLNADIYIDTSKVFNSRNRHLPQKNIYHTLLLDKHKNVQLVGNPIQNRRIGALIKDFLCTGEDSL